jgi:hypothetical protein
MGLNEELSVILSATDEVVFKKATKLRVQLVKATPKLTGQLVSSWTPLKKKGEGHYVLTNTQDYAEIRLQKYRKVKGITYGSLKFPNGINPIIAQMNNEIEKSLKGIK